VLPVVQMAIAIGLTMHNFQRPFSLEDPTWTKLDRQLCDTLNWPGLPNRDPNHMLLETVGYVALVGVLWYAVTIEISGNGQGILAATSGMRKSADVLEALPLERCC
jgi:hypothetical protein